MTEPDAKLSDGAPGAGAPAALLTKVAEGLAGAQGRADERRITIPALGLIGAAALAVLAAAGAALLLGVGRAGVEKAAWLAAAAAFGGNVVGVLAVRPWKEREVGQWPFALLAGQGVSFLTVLFAAASLYSSARPDPVVFAVVCAGGFLGGLLAQAAVYGPRLRQTDRAAK